MMNKENREWLSALADGELQGQELEQALNALQRDPKLQESWRHYHLIRDAVSSNLDEAMDLQLHSRISDAIAEEPIVLAPQRRRPWIKQVAGLAIAASVTAIAIVGVQTMNSIGPQPAAAPMAGKQEYMRIEPTLVAGAEEKNEEGTENRLTPYLVNHNEFSSNRGMQGVLPYVRIVGHQTDK
jgi:sigma-E factor negative regulatory protein RseA